MIVIKCIFKLVSNNPFIALSIRFGGVNLGFFEGFSGLSMIIFDLIKMLRCFALALEMLDYSRIILAN